MTHRASINFFPFPPPPPPPTASKTPRSHGTNIQHSLGRHRKKTGTSDAYEWVEWFLTSFRKFAAIFGHFSLRIEYYDWKHFWGESVTIYLYYAHNIIMFIVYFIFLTNISFSLIFNSTSFTFRCIIRKICIKKKLKFSFLLKNAKNQKSLWLKTSVLWHIEKKMLRWNFTVKKPWKLRGLIG